MWQRIAERIMFVVLVWALAIITTLALPVAIFRDIRKG